MKGHIMKLNKVVFWMVSIVALLLPVFYLLKLIKLEIGFPLMFSLIGCQQLSRGLMSSEEKKFEKITSFGLAGVFVCLAIYLAFTFSTI